MAEASAVVRADRPEQALLCPGGTQHSHFEKVCFRATTATRATTTRERRVANSDQGGGPDKVWFTAEQLPSEGMIPTVDLCQSDFVQSSFFKPFYIFPPIHCDPRFVWCSIQILSYSTAVVRCPGAKFWATPLDRIKYSIIAPFFGSGPIPTCRSCVPMILTPGLSFG